MAGTKLFRRGAVALLQDLIRDSAGEATSTTSLLRQARIVARRLRVLEADRWIESELFGYSNDQVPAYRGPIEVRTYGRFHGPFGSSMDGAPVALSLLPDPFNAEAFRSVHLRHGVSELEDLLKAGTRELKMPWSPDLVARFNYLQNRGDFTLYEGMGAFSIWRSLPTAHLRSVLDGVRARILDFALQLEAEDPEAGERAGESLVPEEKAKEIFQTVINGPGANVALGSRNFTQNSYAAPARSDAELIESLRQAGVNERLIVDLEAALTADRAESDGELTEPGPRVQGWLGRVLALGGRSTSEVGTGVTAGVITQLVLAYFGLAG
ncbi:hypothetical protein AB0424_16175 [Streptomyces sp. NPDC051180]|uniref:AbiTii domain-containing protein n=1 Tax=Streptomyces sp. NPDC051180 TaxID=3155797 RepID=UPI00344F8E82